MEQTFKNTKSILIHSILITFLALAIVSCNKSSKSSGRPPEKVKNTEKSSGESAKVSKVLSTARSYVGTKYKYGGCSRNGIDCSGLVYTSYKSIDLELPRTSSAQSTAGKTVKLEDIKPGDLVFFTDKKGNKKVTHVGIVSEVRSNKSIKFIHASTKLGVVENDLFAEYYISIFLKAVRII